MERFCDKCGTLVSGDGKFCPTCGTPMESVVDLGKPSVPSVEPMQSTPIPTPAPTSNTYQGQSNYSQQPLYPQSYSNAVTQTPVKEMTVGEWMLTIFLSGLGIIGLILLFVWGFGDSTPQPKKNYARAMLIWQAISVVLVFLIYGSMIACAVSLGEDFEDFFAAIRACISM